MLLRIGSYVAASLPHLSEGEADLVPTPALKENTLKPIRSLDYLLLPAQSSPEAE